MLALHIVVGLLMILLIIRHFLDYRELKKEEDTNLDLLFTLYAYKMFYGDMDELKIQKARNRFQEMIRKGQEQSE